MGRAHWRYTRMVNFRTGSRGYLFQGRFFSCVLERDHAIACARYIETNPVRARLAAKAADWRWSSARFHLSGKSDGLTVRGALEDEMSDWQAFLRDAEVDAGPIRRHTRSGWPLGSGPFLAHLAGELGREVRPRPRGRPPARRG